MQIYIYTAHPTVAAVGEDMYTDMYVPISKSNVSIHFVAIATCQLDESCEKPLAAAS